MQKLAKLKAFYLNDPDGAINLLEELIRLTNNNKALQAECKLELADIMLFTGEPWEATLLYSQVDKAFKMSPSAMKHVSGMHGFRFILVNLVGQKLSWMY